MRTTGAALLLGGMLAWTAIQAGEIGPAGPAVPVSGTTDAALDTGPQVEGLESRGQNFLDLPTAEISIGGTTGVFPAQDEAVVVHGRTDGELVLLTLENRTLYAQTSADGGTSFTPTVRVAGWPGEARIEQFTMAAAGSSLYVAYLLGDPGGDVGLRVRRSDDMGRTWTSPTVLVARGNPRHGLTDVVIDANASGRVAVTFDESWEMGDVWAMVSSDFGATWTSPLRLDAADAGGTWDARIGDVHVAADGTVHAAFVQNRGSGDRVWHARSIDGGATFAPEQTFDAITSTSRANSPDLATAADGTVLLAWWDNLAVKVLRSGNGGASFSLASSKALSTANPVAPRLLSSPDSADVLLAFESNGQLRTSKSTDAGASFGSDATAATGVARFGVARTPGGNYVLGWTDRAGQPAAWGCSSTDGGVSWNPPQRADQGAGAAAESRFGGVAVTGSDTAFLAYLDRRSGDGFDVYAADAPVSALDFTGRERRVDTDWPGADANAVVYDGAMATDGGSNVWVALTTFTAGARTQLWVARSADAGRTFGAAVPVSTSNPATDAVQGPRLVALPGGAVYAIWMRSAANVSLVFSRSLDFGATWSPETDLTTGIDTYTMATNASALVVFWSDGLQILYRRSTNQGASFGPPTQLAPSGRFPVACVQGSRIVAAYQEGSGDTGVPSARLSTDSGATWGGSTLLSADSTATTLSVVCDPGTVALAAWTGAQTGTYRAYANRLSGSLWSGVRTIGGPVGPQYFPTVAFAGAATWVLGYADWGTQVFTSRSTDGGLNWATPVGHDSAAPQTLAHREIPQVASDGSGHVWVAWWDRSAGRTSLAARHSSDGGLNFGAVRRTDRGLPQGANVNDGIYGVATLPGLALYACLGQRVTSYWDILLNVWDTADLDRDGSPDAADCDDENRSVYPGAPELCDGVATDCLAPTWPGLPANEGNADGDAYLDCVDKCPNLASPNNNDLDGDGLGDPCDPDRDGDGTPNTTDCAPDDPGFAAGPAEVGPFQVDKPSASTLQLTWGAVAEATAYDVARSTIAQLRADGSTANAPGVSCSQPGTTYSDTKAPSVGTANYYLVRGRQGVCVGTWGTNSAGALRTAAACP